MDEEIIKLAKELNNLYELAYEQIKPNIEDIIKNKINNKKIIEHYLDELLNIPTDKAYDLLKKICNYYISINKETALFYLNEYHEIWLAEEEVKTLKKDYNK